jgi:hypothetical protein
MWPCRLAVVVILVRMMGLEGDGQKVVHDRILFVRGSSGRGFRSGSGRGGARLGSYDADLDVPGRHLGVFLLAHEVDLGRPDIRVPGELRVT